MGTTTIKYFSFSHLPAHLQAVSKPVGELADQFEQQLPDGPEKSAGMRKLLEAKDCFVRASLERQSNAAAELKAPVDAAKVAPPVGAAHAGYSTMQPHQQRVVDEFTELVDKAGKLQAFFNTDRFEGLDAAEQDRMRQQFDAMDLYAGILKARINAF